MKIIYTLFLSFLILTSLNASIKEGIIEGVLIERFSNFIEWPENSDENFIIGIYKNKKRFKQWKKLYKDKRIHNKKVVILEVDEYNIDENFKSLKILFLSSKNTQEIDYVIGICSDSHILTVNDQKDYQEYGFILNFFNKNKKVKFSINQSKLMHSKIKINYRLLKLAKIINPVGNYSVK